MSVLSPGSIVRCRNRDWVLLPGEEGDLRLLRPLTGAPDEVAGVHVGLSNLIGATLPTERLSPSQFALPTLDNLADAASTKLLWQAARLTLRDGATPFRSLGRISFRPRTYQLVPLLMALRLDPVRILLADDVGVGKTIEALLIARELWDRGEIRRLCVLCPPYLCEQWQRELEQKFHLEAVVIRSGTVGQLERRTAPSRSIYQHFPVQVASIDFLKSERNKHLFLLHCPELVIVDEAHGAVAASGSSDARHQRYELVRRVADDSRRHLLLLTATPHSGIEGAFRLLLGLLDPRFAAWDAHDLDESQRVQLARHFVQRTRKDIEHDWPGEHCFPERQPEDATYPLSPQYWQLFERTFEYCREIVSAAGATSAPRQRVRSWEALALLRSVMSSPASALVSLQRRFTFALEVEDALEVARTVLESDQENTDDEDPAVAMTAAGTQEGERDGRQLRELRRLAAEILGSPHDTKLHHCARRVADLLREGFSPILWCRYIATAEYLAEQLPRLLEGQFPDLKVAAVTSRVGGDEERRAKLEELTGEPRRLLVATDCLSEGINLQDHFNAVLHYDLPWNPNRLEQREGRVDRYGQLAQVVKAVRFFSSDSPVDGVVIDVLLNKAREIHRALGTHVPVPEESDSVYQVIFNALFLRGRPRRGREGEQMRLDFGVPEVDELHRRWERDAERERLNRTRFAQRAIKASEVQRELEAVDAVLGDEAAVREFVLDALQRLGLACSRDKRAEVYRIAVNEQARQGLPDAVAYLLPQRSSGWWSISFVSPTPAGAEYLGRNHPFVAGLAQFLLEEALTQGSSARAARCGVIRTAAVDTLTTLALLRIRYLLQQPERAPLLSEEVQVLGFTRDGAEWLPEARALQLLATATPAANIPMAEKRELLQRALARWPQLEGEVAQRIRGRADELEASHRRVRQAVALKVRQLAVQPQLPPDLLGLLVLQPWVR